MRESKKLKDLRQALNAFIATGNGKGICVCGSRMNGHPLDRDHPVIDAHEYTIEKMEDAIYAEEEAIRAKVREQGRAYRERKRNEQAAELARKIREDTLAEKKRKKAEYDRNYRQRKKLQEVMQQRQSHFDACRNQLYDRVEITLHKKVHEKLKVEAEERGTTLSALVNYYIGRGVIASVKKDVFAHDNRNEEALKDKVLSALAVQTKIHDKVSS